MCSTAAGEDCGKIDRYGGSLLVHLARDHRGHFLVYDKRMERLNPDVDGGGDTVAAEAARARATVAYRTVKIIGMAKAMGVPVVMAVKTTDYLVTASTEWSRMQDLT